MTEIRILGVDPSLRNTGCALVTYSITTGTFNVVDLALIDTESNSSTTKTVRTNSKDFAVACHIADKLEDLLAKWKPDVVAVELPVGSQSSRAMASYGLCLGILTCLREYPIIQLTAKEVKAVSGDKNASKEAMIEYATKTYPKAPWLTKKTKGVISYIKANEHLADAACAAIASTLTNEFKLLTRTRP